MSSSGLKVHLYTELLQKKNEQSILFKQKQQHILKQISQGVLDGRSQEREEAKIVNEMSECVLVGHSGPVYSTSIMVDDKYLLSASHDTTVRKWSLLTRSCLVVYQSH